MLVVQLRSKVDDKSIRAVLGKQAERSDFGLLLTEDGTVFKPNGKRLLTLIRGGLSEKCAAEAYPFLHEIRSVKTQNRGHYSAGVRKKRILRDGTVSRITDAPAVRSAIVGAFDRVSQRFPFCRESVISQRDPEGWGTCRPMIQEAAHVFAKHEPDRYVAQLEAAKRTHPAYVIPGTPFTTLTINNCVAGGYHTDAGDYEPGFGVIAVFRRGTYRGCLLGFPAYGVAVDLQDRDVLLFDPHEVHGNTAYEGAVGEEGVDWERISIVFYFREKMVECLPPREELERAKNQRSGMIEEAAEDVSGEAR